MPGGPPKDRRSAIDFELQMVPKKLPTVKHAELLTCVVAQVRVRLSITEAKTMDVCLQFPPDFPTDPILMELKSKTLPPKFLKCVDQLVDAQKEKILASTSGQIVELLRIVSEYFEANSLCVCVQEVSDLRKLLDVEQDERNFFKIRQSKSQLHFCLYNGAYMIEVKVTVPLDYPSDRVEFDVTACNFPPLFCLYFAGQAAEIARTCVEAPIYRPSKNAKKPPTSNQPFVKKPSLYPVCAFMIEAVKRYPAEPCALCDLSCFPAEPPVTWTMPFAIELQRTNPAQLDDVSTIIRIYCGHIHHYKCIDEYMSKPPFPKKCPKCEAVIYHDKWRATDKIREERWAHKQAKQRELEDVLDFLS